jgi:hypothetical protein
MFTPMKVQGSEVQRFRVVFLQHPRIIFNLMYFRLGAQKATITDGTAALIFDSKLRAL